MQLKCQFKTLSESAVVCTVLKCQLWYVIPGRKIEVSQQEHMHSIDK